MNGPRDLSQSQGKSFNRHQSIIYMSLTVFLGAALRLYNLGTESFWFDEIITVHRVSQDFQTLGHQLVMQANVTRNALYYLIAYVWVLPFEMSETSIRSLSVLFGVLSIGTMYLVGRQLFDEKVGLLSALFMAVSEFQIQHSQEARFYSLLVLLSLVSIFCYVRALRTRQMLLWVISGLVNITLFYTHTYGVLIFAVEYVHYLFYWKENKHTLVPWGIAQALLILAIVGGFILLTGEGSVMGLGGGLAWITVPSLKDLVLTIYGYIFPQNYQHSWMFIGGSFVAAVLFFLLAVFVHNFRKKDWFRETKFSARLSSGMMLVILWFGVPIFLPFIYSNIFSPIFVDRYTICAAPAFYLLISTVLVRISRVVPIYISLLAMAIVIVPGLQDYYVADINEQWREVAAYVQENAETNDVVLFAPDDRGYQTRSFDWYYTGSLPSCGIGSNVKDDQIIANIFSECTLGHGRVWVIMRGPAAAVDRFKSYFMNLDQKSIRMVGEWHFVKVSIFLFELPK